MQFFLAHLYAERLAGHPLPATQPTAAQPTAGRPAGHDPAHRDHADQVGAYPGSTDREPVRAR